MMIYRTKLVAVLTIVFGMAIGGGLTFSFLALSGSEDVPIATSATSAHRPRFPSTFVLTGRRMEDDGMVFTGEFKIPGEFRTPTIERVFTLMDRGDFRPCFEYAPPFRITGLTFVSYRTWLPSSRGLACL